MLGTQGLLHLVRGVLGGLCQAGDLGRGVEKESVWRGAQQGLPMSQRASSAIYPSPSEQRQPPWPGMTRVNGNMLTDRVDLIHSVDESSHADTQSRTQVHTKAAQADLIYTVKQSSLMCTHTHTQACMRTITM